MRRVRPLVPLVVLLLAACDPAPDVVITGVDDEPTGAWSASLSGEAATPQASGTVQITHFNSYFLADASITGLAPSSTYQWRTYFGTCAARIGQLGANANPSAYKAIQTDANGSGTSQATVADRLRADSSYHIRVLTFTTGPTDTTWYACGNLQRSQ